MSDQQIVPHKALVFTPSLEATPAPTGFRWSVVRWRETKNSQRKKHPTIAVLVPIIEVKVEKPEILQAAIERAVCEMQDNRIRTILTSMLEDDTSLNLIGMQFNPSEYDEQGIAQWMETTNTGGRLSADLIKTWFANIARPAIYDWLAEEKGDDFAKKAAAGYEAVFTKLASPVTPILPTQLEKMAEFLAKLLKEVEEDRVITMLVNAIDKRMPKPEEDILASL